MPIEPPKPPYDPMITLKKAGLNALVSSLMVGLVAMIGAMASDANLRAQLPIWALPLSSMASTALINWLKNRNNPTAAQYVLPPAARI